MKSFTKTLLGVLLLICIIGPFPIFPVDGADWLDGWDYRQGISISGSSGAGTNYQVYLNVTYDANMQTDFDDLRFTPVGSTTEWDYWIEYKVDSSYADVWVEIGENLNFTQVGYMYYGNDAVSTTSDGETTFLFFDDFENDNLNRWTLAEANWATQGGVVKMGSFAAFGDASAVGRVLSETFTDEIDYDIMIHSWTRVSNIAGTMYTVHGLESNADTVYLAATKTNDVGTNQGGWLYYTENTIVTNTWYRYELAIDFTDTELQFWLNRVAKTTRPLADVGNAVVADIEKFQSVTSSTAGHDQYLDDFYIRKWLNSEPIAVWGSWNSVDDVEFFFPVRWDPTFQFGYDVFFIVLGLIMIPVSTMYLVRGGIKKMSRDKLFYGLIIFVMGLGLVIGGVMP